MKMNYIEDCRMRIADYNFLDFGWCERNH